MASAERSEIVDVGLDALYSVITDYVSYPKFVTGMKTTRIESADAGQSTVFFDLDLMKRVQYTVIMDAKKTEQEASVQWKLKESAFFKINNGSWKLKAVGPSRCEVTYGLELDFSFMAPGFVVKGLIATTLPENIKTFVNEAKKRAST